MGATATTPLASPRSHLPQMPSLGPSGYSIPASSPSSSSDDELEVHAHHDDVSTAGSTYDGIYGETIAEFDGETWGQECNDDCYLTFGIGERIQCLEPAEGDWAKGRLQNGLIGWYPSKFAVVHM